MTIAQALKRVSEILATRADLVSKNLITPEAEQIVQAAIVAAGGSDVSRSDLYLDAHRFLTADAQRVCEQYATRRAAGELLQYVTGWQVFLDHAYQVGPGVLVPRPETEVLVALASENLDKKFSSTTESHADELFGLEVGLGSGAISIELLSRFSGLKMLATEVSERAASWAGKNAEKILGPGAQRLKTVRTSASQVIPALFTEKKADFLISNPPYLLSHEAEFEVSQHEPSEALFAPKGDPLFFYREIAVHSRECLKPGGVVFLEVPFERVIEIDALFVNQGWITEIFQDLTGRDRVMLAHKESPHG